MAIDSVECDLLKVMTDHFDCSNLTTSFLVSF